MSSSAEAKALPTEKRSARLGHLRMDLDVRPFDVKDAATKLPTSKVRLDAALLLEWHAHSTGSAEPKVELAEMYGAKLVLTRRIANPVMLLHLQHPGGETKELLPNQFELFDLHNAEDIHRLIGEAMGGIAPDDLD